VEFADGHHRWYKLIMRRVVLVVVLALGVAAPGAAPGRPTAATRASFDPTTLRPYLDRGAGARARAHLDAGDAKRAAADLAAYLKAHPRAADARQAELLHAVALMRDGQYAAAAPLFRRLEKRYPLLQPYHAYYAARCALEAKHPEVAVVDAARVPAGTPLEDDALKLRGDAYSALGQHERARHAYETYLKRFPGGARAQAVRFRLALSLERLGRPPAEILPLYRRVYLQAPPDPIADEAFARLQAVAATLPRPARDAALAFDAAELTRRGARFARRNRSAAAEPILAAALSARGLTPALECEARFLRAQAAFRQRPRSRSAPLYEASLDPCARARDTDRHAKALYQAGRAYTSKGDPQKAMALYARVEAEHPTHPYADDARLRRADLLDDAGDGAAAAKLLEELPARYPHGDMRGEALWRLAWRAWKAGQMSEVVRWTKANLTQVPREDGWRAEGRAFYWHARALERLGDRAQAGAAYERGIRAYPLAYYAWLSLLRLEKLDPRRAAALRKALAPGKAPAHWRFAPRPLFATAGFKRGVELLRLGLGAEARTELARVGVTAPIGRGAAPPPTDDARELGWLAALLYDRAGQWAQSHSIARHYLVGFKREYPKGAGILRWRLGYPRAFPTIIPAAAQRAHIPPELLWAIAREESAFNPTIVSRAQAVGLTQLLVKTARRFAPKGVRVTRERLFDPALNARIGAAFLGFLRTLWHGNLGLVVPSYNAGEAAVRRWTKERGTWSLDEFIEAIPYDETRGYSKRVLNSYFVYCWLDGTRVPPLPLK
jgi:soluble lytic murein transglycosylase